MVQIQSSAKFYNEDFYLLERRKYRVKDAGMAQYVIIFDTVLTMTGEIIKMRARVNFLLLMALCSC